ncbi:MAG: hypothetical protein K8I82_18525, partial [Anaerolineae bacterium]|nr:hypothetical protein [Anaerolineae bacterium]
LTPPIAHHLIEQNIIFGGMLPKVHTALHMVEKGARKVIIHQFRWTAGEYRNSRYRSVTE